MPPRATLRNRARLGGRAVVSRTAETNAVTTYFVSRLAGPRIGKQRVAKGDEVRMSEYQARALLASGSLVTSADKVDDPLGEAAAAAAAEAASVKAAADAKAVSDKASADAKAADAKVAAAPAPADKAATAPTAVAGAATSRA